MAANSLQIRVLLSALDKVTSPLKRIMAGSNATAKALKDTRDKLKALNAQQADVESYRKQHEAVRQTGEQLAKAQERLRKYQEQLKAMEAPSAAFQKTFINASTAVDKLKAKHSEQRVELQRIIPRLKDASIDTRDLAGSESQLRNRIEATTQAYRQQQERMKAVAAQQERLARAKASYEKSKNFAGNAAIAGGSSLGSALAMSQPLKAVFGAYAPAEDAATQLKASMMGADGSVSAEFKKITDLATQLGDRLPGTTADFQEMMTMLRRQGISAQSILGGTGEAAAYLGVQLKMPVTEAAEFAAKMQDATRTGEKDMLSLMDMIQRTYYLGVDSGNMLSGFASISPALDVIKKSGLDAANALAPLLVQMDQVGMEGSAAGNALRKIFQLGMDTKKVGKANKNIKKYGIQLDFTDGKGEFGGVDNLYKQLEKLKKLNTEQRLSVMKDIFGDDSETLTALNSMMSKGIEGYREVQGKMQAQADLRKRVDQQLGTLTNTLEAAQGSFTNMLSEFGAAAAPELKQLINLLGSVASNVGAWARENPKIAGGMVIALGGLTALAAAFGAMALAVAGVLGPMLALRFMLAQFGIRLPSILGLLVNLGKNVLPIVATGVRMLGAAAMANPVLAIIMGLITAGTLLYTNWSTVGPWFASLWQEIKNGVNGGISGILQLLANFSPIGIFYSAWAAVLNYMGVELPARFTDFGSMIISGLVNGITNNMGKVKDAVVNAAGGAIDWFKEKLDIHSPSRVFAELGGFTMAGLAVGLAKNEDGPLSQMASTAKRLTAAGAVAVGAGTTALPAMAGMTFDDRPPAAQAAAAPMVIQGDTVTIHLNVGAGVNAKDLAQQIGAVLDQREREKAARLRSRLSDKE